MNFLAFLIIGAISGWLAGKLWRGEGFGLLGNIIIGVLGGVVGGWLAGHLGIGSGGFIWQIVIAVAGAWLLLFLFSLVNKK